MIELIVQVHIAGQTVMVMRDGDGEGIICARRTTQRED